MKHIQYKTQGTCSQLIELWADDEGVIKDVKVVEGCNGNLKGICALIKGMKLEDVKCKFRGIRCGNKPTSCPDQISRAIEELERLGRDGGETGEDAECSGKEAEKA